jgi:hypothetical protein
MKFFLMSNAQLADELDVAEYLDACESIIAGFLGIMPPARRWFSLEVA